VDGHTDGNVGIYGLLITQGLKKRGVSFDIFEKESTAGRSRDWGMAYFLSADYLPYLLSPELVDRLKEIQGSTWRIIVFVMRKN
jgi:hypothetical protein